MWLRQGLRKLEQAGFNLGLTGISAVELNRLLGKPQEAPEKPEVEFSRELLLEHNYIVLYFDNPLDCHESFALAHRTSALSLKGAKRIVRHALTYAAQPYSVARLLAQGYEKATGKPVTLKFGPAQVICSSLVALSYWIELGTRFDGKPWRRCTPDDIRDHVQKTPG